MRRKVSLIESLVFRQIGLAKKCTDWGKSKGKQSEKTQILS